MSLWPNGFEQREQLGDALHAANRNLEARRYYQAAVDCLTHDMEASAREFYAPDLQARIAATH